MEKNEINVKLVEMAKKGDKEAIAELCQKSMRLAYFMAVKVLGNETDAEDIMSDTMVTIVEKLKDLNEPKAFVGWMNRIVVNKCKNFLAKNKPVYLDDEGMEAVENAEIDDYNKEFLPEDCVLSKEKREVLMEIINEKTTYAERMSVLMFYYNDDSIKTIAAEMNCAEITVKTRLASARKKIKDGIEEKFGKGVTLMTTVGLLVLSKALKAEASEAVVPEAVAASVSAEISRATAQGANVAQKAVTNTANSMTGEMGKKVGKEVMKKAIAGKIALGVAGAAVVVGVVAGAIALGGKSGKDADKEAGTKTKAEALAEEAEKEAAREAEETYRLLARYGSTYYMANANEEVLVVDQYQSIEPKVYYNVTCAVSKDSKHLLVDMDGNEITEPGEYEHISRVSKSVFCVKKDGKYGAVDYKGNVVIPIEYDNVSGYEEEEGSVKLEYILATPKEGGEYAVFNDKGQKVITTSEEIQIFDFDILLPAFGKGYGVLRYEDIYYSMKDGSKIGDAANGDIFGFNLLYSDGKVTAYDENLEVSDVLEIDDFEQFTNTLKFSYDIRTTEGKYYSLDDNYKIVAKEEEEKDKTTHTLANGKVYKSNIDEENETLTISDDKGNEVCVISISDVYKPNGIYEVGNFLSLSTRSGRYFIDLEKGEFFLEKVSYSRVSESGVVYIYVGEGKYAEYTLFNENFMIDFGKNHVFEDDSEGFWAYNESTGEAFHYNLKGEVTEQLSGVVKYWELVGDCFMLICEDDKAVIISNEDGEILWNFEYSSDNKGYLPYNAYADGVEIIELEDGFYSYEGKLLMAK